MERAYDRSSNSDQVRASVQTVLGRSALNEFRVEFNHQDSLSASVSDAPAIIVIDAFSRGGAGVSSEGSNRTLEVADNFDFNVGKHAMRVGMLLESGAYINADARNAAGTFTFGSLEAFLAGAPNTFTQRLGQVRTAFSQNQLGVYWQDDFRLNRSLAISVGVREELQSHVGDAMNFMPRLGFTYTPQRARTTIRGGYGVFHDWYDSNLYDQTLRVTGARARSAICSSSIRAIPIRPAASRRRCLAAAACRRIRTCSMPYVHQASIGVERPLTPTLNVQASFMLMRGRNQLRSRNVNAPDAFGVRPEPDVGTVTQIESTGRSATDRFNVNLNYRVPGRRTFMNVDYTWSSAKNHADNPLSLPADSLNPDAEWGPSSQDIRHRLNAMVNFGLPLGVRANIGGTAQSAAPYTITTGRDDNATASATIGRQASAATASAARRAGI